MAKSSFDVGIIGAGPGGYVAAIRCAQLGLKTVIVEKQSTLGGTCLNWGCIPSKALLDSSEHYHQAVHKFAIHGIKTGKVSVDWAQMLKRKDDVVANTTQGIDYLMKKNNITVQTGVGTFQSPRELVVTQGKKTSALHADKWIIATGSEVMDLPCATRDGRHIIGSNEAISLPTIPKDMVVIGGGVIGVELGSVYARLGTKVTVVEFFDRLIPTMDKDLGKALQRSLKSLDMAFHFKTKVTDATVKKGRVHVTAEDKNGASVSLDADVCLVAIGRRPNTDGLGLDAIGVALDDRGRVAINDRFETNVPGIYAIGDAARRELAEETGYRARTLTSLGGIWMAPGFCNEFMHVFLAEGLTPGPTNPDADEAIEHCPTPMDHVMAMIADQRIQDAKTILAMQWVHATRRI